ncbi:unnamed protein product [Amoebophrya sp. A25]|nr:unnamed protein product [Amoebophrya sp. A25]|eukprot:GSA25T00014189001.1
MNRAAFVPTSKNAVACILQRAEPASVAISASLSQRPRIIMPQPRRMPFKYSEHDKMFDDRHKNPAVKKIEKEDAHGEDIVEDKAASSSSFSSPLAFPEEDPLTDGLVRVARDNLGGKVLRVCSTFEDLFYHVRRSFKRLHGTGRRNLPRTKIHGAQFLQMLYNLRLVPPKPATNNNNTILAASGDSVSCNISTRRAWAVRGLTTESMIAAVLEENNKKPLRPGVHASPGNATEVEAPFFCTGRRRSGRRKHLLRKVSANAERKKLCLEHADENFECEHENEKKRISSSFTDGLSMKNLQHHRVTNTRGQRKAKPMTEEQRDEQRLARIGTHNDPKKELMSSPELLDLMIHRGYYCKFIEKKVNSAGPGRPPKLSLEDCKRWAAYFYLLKLKRDEAAVVAQKNNSSQTQTSKAMIGSSTSTARSKPDSRVEHRNNSTQDIKYKYLHPKTFDPLAAEKLGLKITTQRRPSTRYKNRPREQPRCVY